MRLFNLFKPKPLPVLGEKELRFIADCIADKLGTQQPATQPKATLGRPKGTIDINRDNEIRKLYAKGGYTMRSLAKMYGCTDANICRIVKKRPLVDKKNLDEDIGQIRKKDLKIKSIQGAREIRALYATGEYTQTEIAKKYGCSTPHVHRVINGTRWKEYDADPDKLLDVEPCEYVKPRDKKRKISSTEEADEIRRLYKSKKYTYTDLSKLYGCTRENIGAVIRNETWVNKDSRRLKNKRCTANHKKRIKATNKIKSLEQAEKIRALYASGAYKQYELAAIHGCSEPTISAIVRKRIWVNDNNTLENGNVQS